MSARLVTFLGIHVQAWTSLCCRSKPSHSYTQVGKFVERSRIFRGEPRLEGYELGRSETIDEHSSCQWGQWHWEIVEENQEIRNA
jgi:hypothetical protein